MSQDRAHRRQTPAQSITQSTCDMLNDSTGIPMKAVPVNVSGGTFDGDLQMMIYTGKKAHGLIR